MCRYSLKHFISMQLWHKPIFIKTSLFDFFFFFIHWIMPWVIVCAQSLQLCVTICNCMDCSPPGSSVHGASAGKNTGVGCHSRLQGIVLTQGSNLRHLCLLHFRWILYHHLGSLFFRSVVLCSICTFDYLNVP